MPKKQSGNKKVKQSNFAKLSIFQPNKYRFKKSCPLSIKGDPKIILSKIIDNFRFKIPSSLPPMCSMIAGYFSYDTIRYIEKIKNSCKNDLKLPDIRLIRPTTLIIHDNVKKEIFFIKNIFTDIKTNIMNVILIYINHS